MNKKICVIPARMASSRFPGKPMVPMLGLPLILHVWNRCRLEKKFDQVIVATCDKEIFESVTAAGGEVAFEHRPVAQSDHATLHVHRTAALVCGVAF